MSNLPINNEYRYSVMTNDRGEFFIADKKAGYLEDSRYTSYQEATVNALLKNLYDFPDVNIYFDMDGVIAEYDRNFIEAEARKEGYFLNRPADEKAIQLLNRLAATYNVNLFICSAVYDNNYAIDEKNEWLDRHGVSSLVTRLFVPFGQKKSDYITSVGINVLIDDFSKNLHEWVEAGGIGIKFRNGLNGNYGTWTGPSIDCTMSVPEMFDSILDYITDARSSAMTNDHKANLTRTKEMSLIHLQNILNHDFNGYQDRMINDAGSFTDRFDINEFFAKYNICKLVNDRGYQLELSEVNSLLTKYEPLDRIYGDFLSLEADKSSTGLWLAIKEACSDVEPNKTNNLRL